MECPQTKNTELIDTKQQTQKNHQRTRKAQQKQTDPQGQPSQVARPPKPSPTAATTSTETMEILSIHINDTQTSTYNENIGNTNIKTLFDSGATLSCISEQCYDKILAKEPDQIIDANAGPPIIIMSASNMTNSPISDDADYTSS